MSLTMSVMKNKLAVVKLKPKAKIPKWMLEESFVSITRTSEELSVVLEENLLGGYLDEIGNGEVFKGFVGLKVEGPLDFSLIGILSEITGILAEVKVSVFVISTFDTDYIWVNEGQVSKAIEVLEGKGISINN